MTMTIDDLHLDRQTLSVLDPASVDGLSKTQRDAVAEAIVAAWQPPDPGSIYDGLCESAVYIKMHAAHK
jgi:hypothetical protein